MKPLGKMGFGRPSCDGLAEGRVTGMFYCQVFAIEAVGL